MTSFDHMMRSFHEIVREGSKGRLRLVNFELWDCKRRVELTVEAVDSGEIAIWKRQNKQAVDSGVGSWERGARSIAEEHFPDGGEWEFPRVPLYGYWGIIGGVQIFKRVSEGDGRQ